MTYTNAAIMRVVEIAVGAARAHQAGATVWTPPGVAHPQKFDLRTGGMCNRFVRQVHETALGLRPFSWPYRAGRAIRTLDALDAAGFGIGRPAVSALRPGDIIGNRSGTAGHIAIFVGVLDGVPTIAENTSSATRGNPRRAGTKLTALADMTWTVAYRLAAEAEEPAAPGPERIPVYVDGVHVDEGELHGNRTMIGLRKILEAAGCEVDWLPDQREVWITTPGRKEARP